MGGVFACAPLSLPVHPSFDPMSSRKRSAPKLSLPRNSLISQVAELRELLANVNLRGKKRDQINELLDGIEHTATEMTGLDNSPPPSSVESSPREYDFEKKKGKIRGLWKNLGETGLRKNVNKRGITSLAEANRNDSMVNLRLFLENRSANITL